MNDPEVVKCECGKASMTYKIIGEDLWSAVAVNTLIISKDYGKVCICKNCKNEYDKYDSCMVKLFNEII